MIPLLEFTTYQLIMLCVIMTTMNACIAYYARRMALALGYIDSFCLKMQKWCGLLTWAVILICTGWHGLWIIGVAVLVTITMNIRYLRIFAALPVL